LSIQAGRLGCRRVSGAKILIKSAFSSFRSTECVLTAFPIQKSAFNARKLAFYK
jgi:hypothetical protein